MLSHADCCAAVEPIGCCFLQAIGLRAELPRILATPSDALSPRMLRVIEDLAGDWPPPR
jgi:hypothetical protein